MEGKPMFVSPVAMDCRPAQSDATNLKLPEGLEIRTTFVNEAPHHSVFCTHAAIPRGTRFGPFKGKVVHISEMKDKEENSRMWEIFKDGKLSHFIDGRGIEGNWMTLVNSARNPREQNLEAIQVKDEIYYEACKDILLGSELLVWYGENYKQCMMISSGISADVKSTEREKEIDESSPGFQCERCGKVFAYQYYRDKHLKYTRCVDKGDRKFPCHLCDRSFEKRDRLRIHILHVHEKHRPHKCTVCDKSFSQSSSLNKHMRVHSGERPYKCVYCSKAFTASSILRTHIRQHSGEKPFKCKHCGKAFASHAAHDSHVRRTHTKDKACACAICGKTFNQTYELSFHMRSHKVEQTNPDTTCEQCGLHFVTPSLRHDHVTSGQCQHAKRVSMRSDSSSSGFSDGDSVISNDSIIERPEEYIDVEA
ncbi:PR domain zinc finger protein 14-like [Lingula anatina]|nr:PR domain zinc finger protein 14-like [Lingula anatina]|eukprot:XP_023930800.1 PR domain zinc finger protein 14-like [Lingula anatina]